MKEIQTDVLVVGGGTGGVAAAIQSARRGAQTVLVSEFDWLGGMLTTAGVPAPDGLELAAFQTGIWGAFLRSLQLRQWQGLDHGWVSFFTYEPQVGAAILAEWVQALPNLTWISGQCPIAVHKQGKTITAVRFPDYQIQAKVTLDGTELGDLLALADVPYRWGWEWQSLWQEPSAPIHPSTLTQTYSVQAPTWVFVLQDFADRVAPEIIPPVAQPAGFPRGRNGADLLFAETWAGYGAEAFLNYGRLPGNRFMINWPQQGNDYGLQADRLIGSAAERQEFLQAAYGHAQAYAHFLQQQLGRRYGLATDVFPDLSSSLKLGGGAYALHPYYRESRRLQGLETVREQDILPRTGGQVATLPVDAAGQVTAIAIGNYANDHHYPGFKFTLHPKSIRWGGRWTGTPFSLPYGSLVPEATDGLLVCEKNISVSHIANGATRLQPTVLGIGQAAGMAAALCVEQNCQPRSLPVRLLQAALLQEPTAPMALVPLFNVPPQHPSWLDWQYYYLNCPQEYPPNGYAPIQMPSSAPIRPGDLRTSSAALILKGIFQRQAEQRYAMEITAETMAERPDSEPLQGAWEGSWQLVTLRAEVDQQLRQYPDGKSIQVQGRLNRSGRWLLVEAIYFSDLEMNHQPL